jgi:hypothetical protein
MSLTTVRATCSPAGGKVQGVRLGGLHTPPARSIRPSMLSSTTPSIRLSMPVMLGHLADRRSSRVDSPLVSGRQMIAHYSHQFAPIRIRLGPSDRAAGVADHKPENTP